MNIWTKESMAIMDEIRDYIEDSKVIPGAPEWVNEKYEKLVGLLKAEEERQITMMCQ